MMLAFRSVFVSSDYDPVLFADVSHFMSSFVSRSCWNVTSSAVRSVVLRPQGRKPGTTRISPLSFQLQISIGTRTQTNGKMWFHACLRGRFRERIVAFNGWRCCRTGFNEHSHCSYGVFAIPCENPI